MPSAVAKSLSRLSRETLAQLSVQWAKSSKNEPYLMRNRDVVETQEEDYLHKVAQNRSELVEVYDGIRGDAEEARNMTKRDIIDRIVDGDWRRGLTYQQLADIDFAHLEENDSMLRWSALKIVPLEPELEAQSETQSNKRRKIQHNLSKEKQQHYPGTNVALFVQNIKAHINPVVKAQYHTHHLESLDIPIVRVQITPDKAFAPLDTNMPRQNTAMDASRTVYIALPDSCPYVYVSIPGTGNFTRDSDGKFARTSSVDMSSMKRVLLEAIPKALSKPQCRWSLKTTSTSTKSLRSLHLLCGGARVGATGGAFAKFANILSVQDSEDEDTDEIETSEDAAGSQQHRTLVEERFGPASGQNHAKLDRVHITINDLMTTYDRRNRKRKADDADECKVSLTMIGTDVIAGLKQLAMEFPGCVDLENLPGALTGQLDVTSMTL